MQQKVSPGTIARTIVLILAVINQLLGMTGHSLIMVDDETINTLVSNIWIVAAALVAWWKNNSFTQAAITGDETMKQCKSQTKTDQ